MMQHQSTHHTGNVFRQNMLEAVIPKSSLNFIVLNGSTIPADWDYNDFDQALKQSKEKFDEIT